MEDACNVRFFPLCLVDDEGEFENGHRHLRRVNSRAASTGIHAADKACTDIIHGLSVQQAARGVQRDRDRGGATGYA